jgi:hypothetical protein
LNIARRNIGFSLLSRVLELAGNDVRLKILCLAWGGAQRSSGETRV